MENILNKLSHIMFGYIVAFPILIAYLNSMQSK